ncbi:hypothetical protein C1H46_000527 [Malus baccata]|uniref:ATP-dependent Clp protease proteolytic subunit n=1 Tax=Malus baccata TaxID=106549 RepID=A0A540NS77_MALBA|nr:hypothetical protein C1H46_000527 [Malus baccata]
MASMAIGAATSQGFPDSRRQPSRHHCQVERSVSYNEHRPKKQPPNLPSLLLHRRIVYIGMPLVRAVTELIVAELMYLQCMDPKQPIYIYINSTGTTSDDDKTLKNEVVHFKNFALRAVICCNLVVAMVLVF